MNQENKKARIETIMRYYGFENQLEQFIEECGEAVVAAQKLKRAENEKSRYGDYSKELREKLEKNVVKAKNNLLGEIADVIVMSEQMKKFFGSMRISGIIDEKINRQIERIEEAKKYGENS